MTSPVLPTPTTDQAEAVSDLREHGYCVLADVLDVDTVARLRHAVDLIAHRERGEGTSWNSSGNQKCFNLVNHGLEFLQLAEHPTALTFAAEQLGPHPLLSSLTANVTRPSNVQQGLHADQQYVPPPWSHVSSMNVVWALDDFTEDNGATVVVPGSHREGRPPQPDAGPLVSITGPAGSAVVLDGRVWHASGVNRTADEARTAILAHYCAPWIRQQENVFRSLDPSVRARLTPGQRALLGYDVWSGLGVVGGPPREWIGRSERTGPTNADGLFDETDRDG
jgi:ectoine hydroxylase-related dioxygenase (phytanoyl-CoA dioxygenase family)